jgi:hypothetical protein
MDDGQRLAQGVGLGVRVGQAAAEAADDENGEIDGHPAPQQLVPRQELLQVHPVHILHHHEILAGNGAQVVGLDDVGVDEVGHQARFPHKVRLELGHGRETLLDDLDGDELAKVPHAGLVGLVDNAHPALGDLADQPVSYAVHDVALDSHPNGILARMCTPARPFMRFSTKNAMGLTNGRLRGFPRGRANR